MNIILLGGSPKGEKSVTMQYVNWLQKNCTEHQFEVIQVAQPIAQIEKDMNRINEIKDKVASADAVLWAFPLYYCLVHAGYKRFIELIWERGIQDAFAGKHAAILATSIHFFDSTAVEYMRGICEDLDMMMDEVFSAGMQDITLPGGTQQLELFFKKWMRQVESGAKSGRKTAPILYNQQIYTPSPGSKISPHPIKVGIVTQSGVSTNLDNMVSEISSRFSQTEVYDLSQLKIAGNCLGCLKCGYNYQCVYEGKDDVINTYRKLKECDAILFCGFIKDRYLSARWKTFMDRWFFSTHSPFFPGMPIGMVVSGPMRQLSNLREIFNGFFGVVEARMAGIVSDEDENIDACLSSLADSLYFYTKEPYTPPLQFTAVGGKKVFRDEIFSGLGGVFPADYKYYRKHGLNDFPHKKIFERFSAFIMRTAMKIPAVRKNMQDNMKDYMLMSYQKVLK